MRVTLLTEAEAHAIDMAIAKSMEGKLCSDCPPEGHSIRRCSTCPRSAFKTVAVVEHQ